MTYSGAPDLPLQSCVSCAIGTGLAAVAIGPGVAARYGLGRLGREVFQRWKGETTGDPTPLPGKEAGPKPGSAGGPGAGKRFSNSTRSIAESETEGNCVFCGQKTTEQPGPLQKNIDHAIPKSRGGNNTIGNAQTTCRTCNLNKGTMTTEEFMKMQENGL